MEEVNFPALGDSSTFEIMGAACALALRESPLDFSACVNQMRPTGAIIFYSIPNLITQDPVTLAYVKLLMNLVMIAIAIYGFDSIRKRLENDLGMQARARKINFSLQYSSFLLLFIGLVPVSLSDLPSMAMALLGIKYFLSWLFDANTKHLLISGISFGLAISFRQHVAVIVFLMFIYGVFSKKLYQDKNKFLQFFRLLTPMFGVILLQIGLMVHYFRSWWLWVPSSYKPYMIGNKQPYVDMAVWMEPYPGGAYLSQLPERVPEPLFYLARMFPGLFRFELSPYGGRAPLETVPLIYNANLEFWVTRVSSIFLLFLLLFIITQKAQSHLVNLMVFTGVGYAIFNAVTVHTEVRYYLYSRVTLILVISSFALSKIRVTLRRKI